MNIYAIWDTAHQTFVRFGTNGEGVESYCIFRGERVFFQTREQAEAVMITFDHPENYIIRKFAEI